MINYWENNGVLSREYNSLFDKGDDVVLGKTIRSIYHLMQRHYLTFRVLVWFKEKGITRRINFLITHGNDSDLRMHPTKQMLQAHNFFSDKENVLHLKKVMSYLADEKSRKVLSACIDYRTKRIPIPKELYSEYDQYFVSEIIHLHDGEVFVDGGAYTGDTIQQLLDEARKQKVIIRKIIAFEPEDNNYKLLSKFYGNRNNISLVKKGLSDKEDVLLFNANGVVARIVDDENKATDKIEVVNLDNMPECKDVSFIKMDIEGAEWAALHGARNLIIRNKPTLTICLYHSDEDMIRLIEFVHDLDPEYKLYVRHHSKSNMETVLYAVM